MFEKLLCLIIGGHDWTSKADEGVKPEFEKDLKEMSADEILNGFWDYAEMYCKRCGKSSGLNPGR